MSRSASKKGAAKGAGKAAAKGAAKGAAAAARKGAAASTGVGALPVLAASLLRRIGVMRATAGLALVALALLLVVVIVAAVVAGGTASSGNPMLGFSQPYEVEAGYSEQGLTGPTGEFPEGWLAAFQDVSVETGVPWGVFAATARLTTDAGRYSPYDDACPARDVLASVRAATVAVEARIATLEQELAAAEGTATAPPAGSEDAQPDSAAADTSGADGSSGDSSDDLAAIRLAQASAELEAARTTRETLLLRGSSEQLGFSHLPCLIDRDPGRVRFEPEGPPAVLPAWDFDRETGRELPPPDGFVFDHLWWRWVDTSSPDEPLSPEGAPGRGPLMLLSPSRPAAETDIRAAARELADRARSAARSVADLPADEVLADMSLAEDTASSDSFWVEVFPLLGVVTLYDDPSPDCRAPEQETSVAAMIEYTWPCELAAADGLLLTLPSGDPSSPTFTVTGSRAADVLVSEALHVAAGFSRMGEAGCAADASVSGVFPVTSAQAEGLDRCDPADNVLAAARVVAGGLSGPPAEAGPLSDGPYGPMLAGWYDLQGAVGDGDAVTSFLALGPTSARAEMSQVCSFELTLALEQALQADGFPPDLPGDDGSDAVGVWLDGSGLLTVSACSDVSEAQVLRTLLRAASATAGPEGSSSAELALLSRRAARLAAVLGGRTAAAAEPAAPVWGVDSMVPRLSHRTLAWPDGGGRPLVEAKTFSQVPEMAVVFTVLYGGTTVTDGRAGSWTGSPSLLSGTSSALPSFEELETLHQAFEALSADGEPSASDLAEEAGVGLQTAGSYLAARRTLAASGTASVSRAEVEAELFRSSAGTVVSGLFISSSAGGVFCPIGGTVDFQPNDWGRGRSFGRSHAGNDIFARLGTPVVATGDFTVVAVGLTDRWRGPNVRGGEGGVFVQYDDASGTRWYNAHLVPGSVPSHIRVGYSGRAGEVIGQVGISGNARSTPPHLHIEMRPGRGDKVNPFPLLFPACANNR